MIEPRSRRWDQETMLVVWLAFCVALISFLFYLRGGELLLYGDAVAHINIARRVFDSRTPGLLQLGTVWLPLPHLLMIPFLLSDWLWQTGIGGSLPSLAAFVFGVVGIFRLVRGSLSRDSQPDTPARVAAWIAAAIFAENPNLMYLQATAMTETLYLALFIWAVVYFSEFAWAMVDDRAEANSTLRKCGLCLFGACLTRYDGWFLAVATCCAVLVIVLRYASSSKHLRRRIAAFFLLAAAAPVLWLAYNAIVYRNPLEFANGPYSAKAIEAKTSTPGFPPHPGSHDLPVAFSFFLKSGELNVAPGHWGRLWVLLAVAGTVMSLAAGRKAIAEAVSLVNPVSRNKDRKPSRPETRIPVPPRLWPLLLLWAPLSFYTLSVAYSGVPIFLPVWWPFSIYNARYGVQLLPAFAVFAALAAYFVARLVSSLQIKTAVFAALLFFAATSYGFVWRAQPISFREAWINSRSRLALERELANTFQELPPGSTVLMYLGDHVGALQRAGIPLRRVIYEGNHRTWKQPSDPDGLWERALAHPAQYADFVIASDGDAVSNGVQRDELSSLLVIHVSGQPRVVIYRTLRSAQAPVTP